MSGANSSTVERAHARVGTTLQGKWRLDKLLGVGGMAAVYAATHRNGARGAIKMLHLEVSLDADARKRFLREGYVANAVDHPGSVRVLDDDVAEDGSAFIVMELLEGESLDSRAERLGGALPPAEVLGFAERLLDVLMAAHQKGIVHRDVKPDNVFVTQSGVIKLLDFGIARLRDGGGSGVSVKLTAEGSAFGTPAFMAPEQALGRIDEIDGRTDIFSVGATMFTLLTGRSVHVTRTINEQLVAQASKPPPPLASVAPHIQPAIAAVVDKALQFERDRRWPDARTMRDAIHGVQVGLGARGQVAGPVSVHAPVSAAMSSMGTVAPSVRAAARPSGKPSAVVIGAVAGALCVLGLILVVRAVATPSSSPSPATSSSDTVPVPTPTATAAVTVTPAASASTPVPAAVASSAPTAPAKAPPAPTTRTPVGRGTPVPVPPKPTGAKKPGGLDLDRQN